MVRGKRKADIQWELSVKIPNVGEILRCGWLAGRLLSLRESHLLQSNYRDKMILGVKQRQMPSGGVRMKKTIFAVALLFLVSGPVAVAHAELQSFLDNLNIQARADMNGFSVKLAAQFGVPLPQVQAIIKTVEHPADAFMCLQLSQMAKKQPEMVVQTYKSNKGKGWGVIAKELGIKPGSPEFHALKRGDFVFTGEPSGSTAGNGKGKGKGHKK
jgi:hypothetical protein